MIFSEPRSAGTLIRDGLIGIWGARGGGFYGLGYVAAFVLLEARTMVVEFQGSDSLASFLGGELVQYVLRLGLMSFVNAAIAFVWPLLVVERLGGWGLLVLAAGYLAFERWLRPTLEAKFPELRRSRRGRRRRRRDRKQQAVNEAAGATESEPDGEPPEGETAPGDHGEQLTRRSPSP